MKRSLIAEGIGPEDVVGEVRGSGDRDEAGDRDDPEQRIVGEGVQGRASSHE